MQREHIHMQVHERSRYAISSDELQISYDDLGQDEPALLLMPGWCGSRAVFEPLLEPCAASRRVLSLDWRGHGRSSSTLEDFGTPDLVADALAVIEASGVDQVVPVALAHSGWVAVALRERLAARVPKLVLLDWIVLDPPPPFLGALQGLQEADQSEHVWRVLRGVWTEGIDVPALRHYVENDMGSYGFDMRARAGREVSQAYARAGNPLRALASLQTPVPTLHLYAQPDQPAYYAAQLAFAAQHSWFEVQKLDARSHFPMFEVPHTIASAIERFIGSDER
jgi:pimeloyl-ACP methyl ester carboxylesterase